MRIFACLVGLVISVASTAVVAQSKTMVLATGDSYTRRTPCQSTNYEYCDMNYQLLHDQSYATYLNPATFYRVTTGDNSGRGGETCTTQEAFSSGPWTGQARGLLAQVNDRVVRRAEGVVSVLIGINDVNAYGVSLPELGNCLLSLYEAMSAKKIIALTYPPVSNTTRVWAPMGGGLAEQNRVRVNQTIRTAVTYYNSRHSEKIRLVDLATVWPDPGAYTVDGAHPNAQGAILMAKRWLQDVCGGTSFIPNCYLH